MHVWSTGWWKDADGVILRKTARHRKGPWLSQASRTPITMQGLRAARMTCPNELLKLALACKAPQLAPNWLCPSVSTSLCVAFVIPSCSHLHRFSWLPAHHGRAAFAKYGYSTQVHNNVWWFYAHPPPLPPNPLLSSTAFLLPPLWLFCCAASCFLNSSGTLEIALFPSICLRS